MNVKAIKRIILIVSAAMLALISVQLFWIKNAFSLQEKAFDSRVKQAMDETSHQVSEQLGCFEYVSKAYVKPGEGLYVIKQEWQKDSASGKRSFLPPQQNPLDSLLLMGHFYGDTMLYKQRSTMLTFPVTAEVRIKMTYVANDRLVFNNPDPSFYDFASANINNYREKLAGTQPLEDKLSYDLFDSLLTRALAREDIRSFQYVIYDKDLDTVLFSRADMNLMGNPGAYRQPLLQDELFNHHYELVLYIAGKSNILIRSITGLLAISVIVILLLVFSFWYFVQSILKQKKLADMKADFVNNMTHEFKTPIANIALAVDTLREQNWMKSEKAERIVDIVARENERMHENVKRVLQMAVEGPEQFRLQKEKIHLHELIETVVKNFELQASSLGARIRIELRAQSDLIEGDETHLVNLIYNLVDNALKFKGDKNPDISISTESSNDRITVMVTDNGIGMNSKEQELIFERFYRVPHGNIHNVKGFGLGLSYVKSIIEAHGGKVSVESEPGKGSCFAVEFMMNT